MSLPLLNSAPDPVRCRRCHRVCRHGTVDGFGPECAVIEGVTVPRRPRRGRVVAADTQPNLMDLINEGVPAVTDQPRNTIPGYEGSLGPFRGEYGKPHVYARDVHSGAGNCVCGGALGDRRHVQAAPGVDVPDWARR